jgi:hypothetical protein
MNYWSPPDEQPFLRQPADTAQQRTNSQELVWHPQFVRPTAGKSLQDLAEKMRSYPAREGKKA